MFWMFCGHMGCQQGVRVSSLVSQGYGFEKSHFNLLSPSLPTNPGPEEESEPQRGLKTCPEFYKYTKVQCHMSYVLGSSLEA